MSHEHGWLRPALRSWRAARHATGGRGRLAVAPAIVALGAVQPRLPVEEAIEALVDQPPDELAEFYKRHKTRLIVADRLRSVDTRRLAHFLASFDAPITHTRARLAAMDSVVGELDEIGRSLDVTVFGIKGLTARSLYPDPALRDFSDWDVAVTDADSCWRLVARLRESGWTFDAGELPWLKRDERVGCLYGQARLLRPGTGTPLFVDVHFGGYSVRHCGRLPIPAGGASPGFQLLGPEENLALGFANGGGDHFATLKDLNDITLCLARSGFDWDVVRRHVQTADLQGYFDNVLDLVVEHLALDEAQEAAVRELRFGQQAELAPSFWAPDDDERCWVTARHAYRHERPVSSRRAVTAAVTALRYYGANLVLEPEPRPGPGAPRIPALDRRTCVRLVPAGEAGRVVEVAPAEAPSGARSSLSPAGTIGVLATSAGDLVVSGHDAFVPTVYYRLAPRLVAATLGARP